MILRLLFPPKCVLCGCILPKNQTGLCHRCRIEAPDCPIRHTKRTFLDSWAAVWYYEGNVRSSIIRYKFHHARHYARVYGPLLAMKLLQAHPEGVDLLTWVPVSPLRKFTRGYDQVELLAQAVGQELGMEPVRTIRKIRHNRPQSGIVGEAQRRANVLGVYRILDPELVRDKKVLLLDDVMTTGATVGEAARVILTAGAKEVHGGVIAVRQNHK